MKFSAIQQKTIDSRNKNVVVSASAGSGKTSVLVERLCQLVLKDRIPIDSILAMTFTEDAAAEMKTRLKIKLNQEEKTPYILDQLALLETADISTIDSFCYKIVQKYYYQIPISYAMSQHVENGPLRQQAFEQAYERACAQLDPQAFSDLKLYFLAFSKQEEDIQKLIQSFLMIAGAKPNPNQWMKQVESVHSDVPFWFFQFFRERIQAMISMNEEMLDSINEIDFPKIKNYEDSVQLFTSKVQWLKNCLEKINLQNYEEFSNLFKQYIETTKRFPKSLNKHDFSQIGTEYKKLEKEITDCLFPVSLWKEDHTYTKSLLHTFIELSSCTRTFFQEEKKKIQILDFSDMEHFAYQLLQIPMIQEEMRNHYEMILVDEFQDTNDLQESIISCIERGNNVFRVGDVKQSIYGFRQAKPDIMKRHMEQMDDKNETLVMSENYRSNASIIEFNNDFYEKIMNSSFLESQFSKEDIAKVGTSQQKETKQYPVRFLFTQYAKWAANQDAKPSLQAAAKLHRMHRVDLIAQDILKHHKQGVPYRSICILTRTHSEHEMLKSGLEAYDIPVIAEIDHGFYTNQAIQIIVSTLKTLNDPTDDIALTAMLCSPIGNVSQMQLSKACIQRNEEKSLYDHIKNYDFMSSFFEIYDHKHLSIPDLLCFLYNYHEFYYNHTSGQDKTNLDLLLEMASTYPDPKDLSGFIHLLEDEAGLDKTSEAFIYGKEEDVVKIKTMHHSKGLQFPIVYILSKTSTTNMDTRNPILFDEKLGVAMQSLTKNHRLKRESPATIAFRTKKFHDALAEEMRVFYVATTRAQQELIIVDCIKSLDSFSYPLNTRAFLQNRSYTSWLLHTYLNAPTRLFQLDEVEDLYERPEHKTNYRKSVPFKTYAQSSSSIESQTASGAKNKIVSWKPFSFSVNTGVLRGTLFHEIAAQCAFPYKEKEIVSFAKKRGHELSKEDISQILALNEDLMYFDWMNHEHEFECSYIVQQDHAFTHGFMDLVVWFRQEIVILDFKTDYVQSEKELIEKYKSQLAVYKKAMAKIYPDKEIKTFIYSFCLTKMCEIL